MPSAPGRAATVEHCFAESLVLFCRMGDDAPGCVKQKHAGAAGGVQHAESGRAQGLGIGQGRHCTPDGAAQPVLVENLRAQKLRQPAGGVVFAETVAVFLRNQPFVYLLEIVTVSGAPIEAPHFPEQLFCPVVAVPGFRNPCGESSRKRLLRFGLRPGDFGHNGAGGGNQHAVLQKEADGFESLQLGRQNSRALEDVFPHSQFGGKVEFPLHLFVDGLERRINGSAMRLAMSSGGGGLPALRLEAEK